MRYLVGNQSTAIYRWTAPRISLRNLRIHQSTEVERLPFDLPSTAIHRWMVDPAALRPSQAIFSVILRSKTVDTT